jgi:hypothetical protein
MTEHLGHGKNGAVTNDAATRAMAIAPRSLTGISALCHWSFRATAKEQTFSQIV